MRTSRAQSGRRLASAGPRSSGTRRFFAPAAFIFLGVSIFTLLWSSVQSGAKSGGPPQLFSAADTVTVLDWDSYPKAGAGTSTTIYELEINADSILGKRYLVEVLNGSPPVTSIRVYADSQQWVGTSEFGASTSSLFRIIELGATGSHELQLWVTGSSGSDVSMRVVRVNDPTYTIYGPQTFVRPSSPAVQEHAFSRADTAKGPFTLRVINGSPSGSNRLTTGTITMNTTQVLSSADFGTGIATISRDVSLPVQDTLKIDNQSAAGTLLKARIVATDSTPPGLVLASPIGDTIYTSAIKVGFGGTTSDETPGYVRLNTRPFIATPGAFTDTLSTPTDGRYPVTIQATNSAKLTTTFTRLVIRDSLAPTIITTRPSGNISIEAVADTFTLAGYFADTTTTVLTVDGDTVASGYGPSVGFTKLYHLDPGQNGILLRAVDALGHKTEWKRWINRSLAADSLRNLSASNATIAGARDFKESVEFLYTASSPVQRSVIADSILSTRASVVRGCVVGRDASALPSVTVSVLGHPEFGSTVSREDGIYDLVVNGGSRLTLKFNKAGYLESQRQVLPPVNDYAFVDSVGMVGKSAKFTVVDLSSGQFSRSRMANDANGDRDVRMLFKPGTIAKVYKPNGDSATFSGLVRTRVSEVTIGPAGQVAMPAALPPGSAYGYCADFSLVEADSIAVGLDVASLETRFNQPVVAYVRNFLHMPVGAFMPNGIYDGSTGQWKPDTDAVVIKILGFSATGDTARIDLTGGGNPADSAQLAAYHFDGYELTHLRSQFGAGDSLMRTMASHFSERDLNPQQYPQEPPLTLGQKLLRAILWLFGCVTDEHGSIIECENCVLGESVPITGTPFTLNYRSYRAEGDKAIRTLRVPLFGDSVPASVQRVVAYMDVAGKRYPAIDTSPAPFDSVTFVWDGKDAYDRVVEGSANAYVAIGYQTSPRLAYGSGTASFGNQARTLATEWTGVGDRGVWQTTWIRTKVALGAPTCATDGLGGWMLSEHHVYDPHGDGALYLGSGKVVLGAEQPAILTFVAGCLATLPQFCSTGDCVSALYRTLSPNDIAVAPDGTIYFSDLASHSIYKMVPGDATSCRVGGTGSTGTYVDNVLATDCPLYNPARLALGPDGSIYFVMDIDQGSPHYQDVLPRVCRITPDGVIHRLTSTAFAPYPDQHGTGDGGPALNATISSAKSIAVGPDGSVFVGDYGASNDNRVRRIGPDGMITTYAGGIDLSPSDAPSRATEIGLTGVNGLAVDENGTLYIAEMGGHRVKQVSRSGIMTTLMAGSPQELSPADLDIGPDGSLYVTSNTPCVSFGDSCARIFKRDPDGTLSVFAGRLNGRPQTNGGYATAMGIAPGGLGIGPDGEVYVADSETSDKIVKIRKPYPTRLTKTFTIPSPDGSEIYAFDKLGKHMWTRDAITGSVRYLFNYDAAGQLRSIYDSNGDSTVISRDGTILIEAPYGQTTVLTLDGEGHLETITDPASQQIVLSTSSDGLLQSFTDARNETHNFTYNGEGRLSVDADPAGGSQTLVSGSGLNRRHVERTTILGRKTTYDVLAFSDGAQQHHTTNPNGLTTSSSTAAYGTTRTVFPTGVVVTDSVGPNGNPNIGMLAPTVARVATSMPSGLSRLIDVSETADPSLGSPGGSGVWSRQVKVNSRSPFVTTLTTSGNPATRELEWTSPLGVTVTTTLDSVGRPLTKVVSGLSATVAYGYDSQGRLTHVQHGADRAWRYAYDDSGRVESVTDTLDRVTGFRYDAADRVIRQTLPDGEVIGFAYDGNGNLIALTPPDLPAHTFDYNEVDQAIGYDPPDFEGDNYTAYSYNDDHQLTQVSRPDGWTVDVRFDEPEGRLDEIEIQRGTIGYDYVASGSGAGLVQSISSPDMVTLHFTYDGPLVLSERTSGVLADTVTLAYDHDLRPVTQSVNGSEITLRYDLDGRLAGAGIASLHYNTSGLIDSTDLAGFTATSSMDYNAYGELRNLRHAWNGSTFLQSMARDALGRIIALTETIGGDSARSDSFLYTPAGRLQRVKRGNNVLEEYAYDGNGNRTSASRWLAGGADTATATFDDQDRMTRYRTGKYVYNANGELAKRIVATDTTTYWYDQLGNLTKVRLSMANPTVTYKVDGRNRRVAKYVNGAFQRGWIWQDGLRVAGELDSTGVLAIRYVYGSRGHAPDYMVRYGTTYRIITDQLGSVRMVVDASSGAVAESLAYDAWGRVTAQQSPGFLSLGFAGGLYDHHTGLVRFGARDYDPIVGRWTLKDPVLFNGHSPNLYAYVASNPANRIDPSGLSGNRAPTNRPVGKRRRPCTPGEWIQLGMELWRIRADIFRETEVRDFPTTAAENAWQHAEAAHRIAELYDAELAVDIGIAFETVTEAMGLTTIEDTNKDMMNNWQGANYGWSGDELLRRGMLFAPPAEPIAGHK